jgi:YHS domain-containing protein
MATSRFAVVTDQEIIEIKENAIPKNTKDATKFGVKLFRGRIYYFQNKHCICSFDTKTTRQRRLYKLRHIGFVYILNVTFFNRMV